MLETIYSLIFFLRGKKKRQEIQNLPTEANFHTKKYKIRGKFFIYRSNFPIDLLSHFHQFDAFGIFDQSL